jgi:hypothetical protein
MSFSDIAAGLSVILGIYAVIPYLVSIVKGKTKPHQMSWIIFTVMNFVIFLSQYLAGGRKSVLVFFVAFIDNLAILLLSIKYGVRDTSRWDRILFISAIVMIAIWVLSRNNALAIWLTVLIDLAASIILILKIKVDPKSENIQAWSVVTFAYLFSLLTLLGKPIGVLYVRPVWGVLSDGAYVVFILYYIHKQKLSKSPKIKRSTEQ